MTDEQEFERMLAWVNGDRDAALLCLELLDIGHLWDDLIDKDTEPDRNHIDRSFYAALVHIPRNPFYIKHYSSLMPLIENAIISWHAANRLEAARRFDIAYGLRCQILNIVTHCAMLTGAEDPAATAVAVWMSGLIQPFEDYVKEFDADA